MSDVLLAIDQGTSSSRTIAFSAAGEMLVVEQQPFEQMYPASGWVEQDPEAIWASVLATSRKALERLPGKSAAVAAIGITNQRETTVLWDRRSGMPLHNAIVWQDRRTAERCRELDRGGHEAGTLARKTGLLLDPYFSATKIAWILDHVAGARSAAEAGHIAFGTIDCFLLWRLTGGRAARDRRDQCQSRLHSTISRRGRWDEALCELFDVPTQCLPQVQDSAGDFGRTTKDIFGQSLPICGVAGDQQAALIGQGCFEAGEAKCTYGTGAFLVKTPRAN